MPRSQIDTVVSCRLKYFICTKHLLQWTYLAPKHDAVLQVCKHIVGWKQSFIILDSEVPIIVNNSCVLRCSSPSSSFVGPHSNTKSGVPCEFLFIVSNLTTSIHLPPRLLGNHQICLDSVRQCPPHLSVGLWASAEICFPKPSYNHHTPTCGKTSPVMKLWPCFGRLVYKNFCILSRFSEIIDNQRNKFHQVTEFGAGFWTTAVGWVLQFALFS